MKRGFRKAVALCLSASLFFTTFPTAFAADQLDAEDTGPRGEDILYELDEMRDKNTKVFRLRNGNNLAYIASALPLKKNL